ncbi:MAG: DUF4342 domain-containing protein [Clostridioides sp.]|jgi:hypothetical protein|nr:DUF4342 domain-containing protein [Clostridioides sp.]
MENKVTIEKIDAIFERVPNTTYAQAKEALEVSDGDVIEAIIYLESKNNKGNKAKETFEQMFGKDGEQVKKQVKEIIQKSSIVRIIIEKDHKVMMNIPLTVGVVGIAIMPVISLIGLSAAIMSKYHIKIQNEDDGEIVDLGELSMEKLNIIKDMIIYSAKEVKDVVTKDDETSDDKDVTDDLINENKENDNQ